MAYGLQEQPKLDDRSRSLLGRAVGLLAAGLAIGAAFLLFSSEETQIEPLAPLPRAIGNAAAIRIRMINPQGVNRAHAWVEQNGSRYDLMDSKYPGSWMDWIRKGRGPLDLEFQLGRDRAPGLVAGKAKLVVEAQANNLRGVETRLVRELPVVLGRPSIQLEKDPVFLRRGGTGAVGFRVGGEWSEAGVKVGHYTFPSFAAKDDPSYRIALFGFPPDLDPRTPPMAFASNLAGDEVTAIFRHHVTRLEFRDREVKLGEPFLERVVPAVDSSSKGQLWERFARINSETRKANDKFLAELAAKTAPEQLWRGAFLLLPKASNQARFADFRRYIYQGRDLNREWHLGVDLASVKNAPIPAANHGTVLFSGSLGIYGNCVVIDHGLGVQSVYGHMSKIDVKAGDRVERGQIIGNTGITGFAGGDHVHMAVLLNGVFVDPVEWSQPKWMDKYLTKLLSRIR